MAAEAAAVLVTMAAVAASLDTQGRRASMGHSQSWPRMPRALLSPSARMPSNCQPVGVHAVEGKKGGVVHRGQGV